MSKRRRYSQQTKLAVLAALERNRGNRYRTAKQFGICRSTLSKWVKERQGGNAAQHSSTIEPDDDGALDERLEQLARQMVEVMPEKVEEATLQELARALTIVLDTINRVGKEKSSHAREKLAEILERYAVRGGEAGAAEPPDGA